jgi:co-chaperonin GroES (HSP10)
MQKAIMDRVFIKPDEKKQGLIIIQDNDETKTGVVVSKGDEVKSVKVGDRVIFFKWDDLPALDGLIAVRENSLLGIIEDE